MAGRKKSAMGTTQFINQKMLQEAPIFSKKKIDNSEFKPQHPLTHLVVANNFIVMALANKSLKRRDLEDPNSKEEEIDLKKTITKTSAKIANLFLDPSGNHLLIAVKSALENDSPALYYLHKTWNQPRQLFKFDKILITAVGWNNAQKDALDFKKTGPILIGTAVGKILETELNAEESILGNAFGMTNSVETLPEPLYQIEKGHQSNENEKITGLQYFQAKLGTQKYFITVTTPTRLYQFIGTVPRPDTRPLLKPVFQKYVRGSESVRPLSELPPSSPKTSCLSFFFNQDKREYNQILNPEKIGWMSELFLFWGGIQSTNDDRSVVQGGRTILFQATGSEDDIPKQAFITEFHALILYKNKLRGICLLNDQEIFVDKHDGTLVGMAQDQMKNIFWVYTEYAVFKYQVSNEGRHVWRIYLDQEMFAEAARLAQMHASDQPEALDIVQIKQAEKLYSDGDYFTSAMTYAKTKTSFEEVTLKFVDLEDKSALKNYLKTKLANLKSDGSEATQSTLVIMWLIEIHQNQLGTMRQCGKDSDDQKDNYKAEEEEFFNLLGFPQVEKCIKENKEVVYNLLGSHGDMRSLVHLADKLNDTERVIRYNLANKQFDKVLNLLASSKDQKLIYTHCHVLLASDPIRTVDKLMEMDRVDPLKLIPALMNVTQSNPEVWPHCVRYLEHATKVEGINNTAEAVHNLLVFLYIQHDSNKLLNYITSRSHLCCDLKYALKLCVEADKKREAVHLYTRLEQHERAVELALKVDNDLAADCASGNLAKNANKEIKKELKQKMWLIVAKHVVSEEGNIENAMLFLKKNNAIITIEDILPFFNDFVTIDNFKEAICDSLRDYSDNITKLKKEMKQASDSAKVIRDEIVAAKTEHHYVKSTDRCDLSSELLMTKPFYIFSCGHKFIAEYLAAAVENYLEAEDRTKLNKIRGRIQELESERNIKHNQSKLDQAHSELEEIIASECLFCGDLMVKNIDTLFIASEDFNSSRGEWL